MLQSINHSRRRKLIKLHAADVLSCLTLSVNVPGDCVVKLSLDVPPNTTILDRFYDPCWQCEMVVAVNEEWPEVEEGGRLEHIEIKATYVVVKLDVVRGDDTQPLLGKPGVTLLSEFMNPALGEPHEVENPFDKSWRNKPSLLQ